MTKVFTEFSDLIKIDPFAKNYSLAIGVAIIVDWLMMPLFTKYMGMYASVLLISLYYIISEMSGLIEHYVHNVSLTSVFMTLVISDVIQIIAMAIYFINIEYFTYTLMLVFSFQAVLYEIYSIKAIQFMEIKNAIPISKFQSLLLFNKSIMILIGLIMGAVYSLFFEQNSYLIMIAIVMSTVALSTEIKLLKYIKGVK